MVQGAGCDHGPDLVGAGLGGRLLGPGALAADAGPGPLHVRMPTRVVLAAVAVELVDLADGGQPPGQAGRSQDRRVVGADGQVGGDHRRGRRQRRHPVLGAVGLEVGQVGAIATAGVGGGVGGRRINRQAQVLLQLVAGQLGRDLRVSPIRLQGASLSETSRWTTSQAIWSATGQRSKATPDPVRQAIAVN
jgi:hypothetical protein